MCMKFISVPSSATSSAIRNQVLSIICKRVNKLLGPRVLHENRGHVCTELIFFNL